MTTTQTQPQINNHLTGISDALSNNSNPDQQRIAAIGLQLITTLLAKNRDYGCSAWKRPVLAPNCNPGEAIMVRMSDKIERIQNLKSRDNAPEIDESIEDTLADLAGYAILELARPREAAEG